MIDGRIIPALCGITIAADRIVTNDLLLEI
jgi:hypothetical protein